ncbi:hypothetical protein N7527_010378 [Penicillium freii]|nr:hypothetical protein N7527_010378 [Penicillium freii]
MELDPACYTVAWIAPLEIEARAALYMLDHKHEGRFSLSRGDDYVYQAGDINGHNVIIATLPAGQEYGTGSAGALAAQIKKFFPNLWFGLLVGVAAGLPNLSINPPNDIRLGDVLVGIPDGNNAGLKAYDLGKQTSNNDDLELLRGGYILATTEPVVRSAIGSIKLQAPYDAEVIRPFYQVIQNLPHAGGTFIDPGQEMDILYDYDESGSITQVYRERREDSQRTRVWYGTIGSGEKLLKNRHRRNELRDTYDLIGLEMEAAGMMNRIPVGVIRGVCDYGDENKNKQWQPYAAAMAAAYAKAVLYEIQPKIPGFQGPMSVSRQTRGIWTVPFHRNPHFVGRQEELSQIQKNMSSDDRPKRMAITGLGGIGKTQMVIELAYQTRERDPECSVFWIPCMGLEYIEGGYLDTLEKLNLKVLPSEDPKQRVKTHLSQESAGRWLLILDNADDTHLWTKNETNLYPLKDYLPQSPQGFVVVTTRNRKIAVRWAASEVISIPQMDLNTATHMLGHSLIQAEPAEDHGTSVIAKLLQELEFLPLAISQAAAYINENGLGVADYLSLLEEQEEDVLELLSEDFEDQWRYSAIKNPVLITWLISFNQVRQLNTLAANYLSFMACIHPKKIPFSLLPSASSRKARTDALGLLHAYSFVEYQNGSQMVSLHRLVHIATRNWLRSEGSLNHYILEASSRVNEVLPDSDPQNRMLWRELLPHAQVILNQNECHLNHEEREELLEKVGLCLQSDGRDRDAEPLLLELIAKKKERPGTENGELLSCSASLAATYRNRGKWKDAEKLGTHVMEESMKVFGVEHPRTAATMADLSSTYSKLGRWKEAKELDLKILHIREKVLGSDHPDTVTTLADLASSYWYEGQREKAERLEIQVLETRKRILSPDHPDTLDAMARYASTLSSRGQYNEAEDLLIHIAGVQKGSMGLEHPDTISTLAELGSTYKNHERWEEAESLGSQVLELRREFLGPEHPDTLTAMSNLAGVYWSQNNWAGAEELEQQVLEANKRVVGIDHPLTVGAMLNLAATYSSQGRLVEAEALEDQVLGTRMKTHGPQHPDTLTAMANLALTYWRQNRWDKAEELETKVLETRRNILGSEHPHTLILMSNLIGTFVSQKKWEEAQNLATQLLESQKRSLGEDHPNTLSTVSELLFIQTSAAMEES